MEKKKSDKLLYIILGAIIIVLIGAIAYIKISDNGGFEFLKRNTSGEIYTSSGNLSEEQRKDINKRLESLYNPLYYILNVKDGNEIMYDEDYLDSAANRYHMVWQTMLSNEKLDKTFEKGTNVFGEKEKGTANIEEKYFNQNYLSIFGENLNKEIFLSDDIEYGITIVDGSYYGLEEEIEKGLFALKADNIETDEESGEYILRALLIAKVDNKVYNTKAIKKYKKYSVLEFPKDLILASADIIYTHVGDVYNIKTILFSEYYEEVITE